ncbi:hypothetical protein ACN47E_000199 [Coniothyrium glycines]
MLITRGFSLTNFVIGSSALAFQMLVLYPWHEKLDAEFKALQQEHARLLLEMRATHTQELKGIREQLEAVNQQRQQQGQSRWLW